MKYSKYPHYRDSGVEWLGTIPEHWMTPKLKLFITTTKGFAFKSENFVEQGIPVVKMSEIKNGTINPSSVFLPKEFQATHKQVLLRHKDIIVSTVGSAPEVKNSAVGQIGIVPEIHNGSLLNQNTVVYSPNKKHLSNSYLPYILKSQAYREHLDLHAHGTANQASLNLTDMLKFVFPCPPLREQQNIANYLDKATDKIDTLISKQTKLIELLKEKRQALISRAVTSGLDSTVPMKDNEAEGLGKIPEHWENYRIDWINSIIRGNTGFKKDELLDNGEYIALQYGKTYKVDEVNETFKFFVNSEFYKLSQVVHCGDTILISTSETMEDLGHSCFYNRNDLGLIGGEQILLKPNGKLVFEKYLYYSSKVFCTELRKYATGLKVFRFNIDDVKKIFISIPSVEEQQEIADYLDDKTSKIDTLIIKSTKAINILKEKRTALISSAVTGKIDVREIA